jgi:alpha-glucoside transport system substrate-binding protein
MPTYSTFQTLATQGKLLRLDKFFDMTTYAQNYSQGWIDFSSVNGGLYCVLPKANGKGTIWYSPKQFQAIGATVPQTWNDLIALSDQIAKSGKYPWSMGVESGAASGWPGADWIAQIYINQNGPDLYTQWYQHKIPWTHSSIKQAFQMFGQIANGTHYINGGKQYILSTNFQPATYLPFDTPPRAYMYYLGDFAAGFITDQFKTIQPGTDFNFFAFPTINPQYKGALTGGADIMAAFKDNDGTRQFMQYISSPEGQSIWPKLGGATSVNKAVSLDVYPNVVTRQAAKVLTEATSFRLGADDLMPQPVENAFWAGVLSYISDPTQLDSILSGMESTALQNYTS